MVIAQLFKASITRMLFFIHGFFSIYLVVTIRENQTYWVLTLGMWMLLIESLYTLIRRKGAEYKYFWPSCLCYLVTLFPAIWVEELVLIEQYKADDSNSKINITTPDDVIVHTTKDLVIGTVVFPASDENAKRVCELGLIIVVIFCRWLLPRGEITREQLSSLLLSYVGTAADIMELFEVFDNEPSLLGNRDLRIAVLVTYTWSILQFTLVTTATQTDPAEEIQENVRKRSRAVSKKLPKYLQKMVELQQEKNIKKQLSVDTPSSSGRQTPNNTDRFRAATREIKLRQFSLENTVDNVIEEIRQRELNAERNRREKLQFHGDLFAILTSIFMQDGPFLTVRLLMTINFGVKYAMHIFFTFKNAVALLLFFYRLFILTIKRENEHQSGFRGQFRR